MSGNAGAIVSVTSVAPVASLASVASVASTVPSTTGSTVDSATTDGASSVVGACGYRIESGGVDANVTPSTSSCVTPAGVCARAVPHSDCTHAVVGEPSSPCGRYSSMTVTCASAGRIVETAS